MNTNSNVVIDEPQPAPRATLSGPIYLLRGALLLFRQRFFVLMGIASLPAILDFVSKAVDKEAVLYAVAPGVFSHKQIGEPIVLAAVFVTWVVVWWSYIALLCALLSQEKKTIRQAYRESRTLLRPFVWVAFLSTAAMIGGFILFIIPGIAAAVWLMFSGILVFSEGQRGTRALLQSREYVRGYWQPVFWRYFALLAFLGVAFFAFSELQQASGWSSWYAAGVSSLASVFAVPLSVAYLVGLYQSLRTVRQQETMESGEAASLRMRWPMRVMFVVGAVALLPLVAVAPRFSMAYDELPPDDSDLLPRALMMPPDGENAYTLVKTYMPYVASPEILQEYGEHGLEFIEESEYPISSLGDTHDAEIYNAIRAGEIWDEDVARALVSLNEPALRDFQEASRRSVYQSPKWVIDPDTYWPYPPLQSMNNLRILARIQAISAALAVREGDAQRAIEETLAIIRLGHAMQHAQGDMIGYLVGTALKNIGGETLGGIVPDARFTSSEWKQYALELFEYHESRSGISQYVKVEYALNKRIQEDVDRLFRGESDALEEEASWRTKHLEAPFYGLSYLYQPNATRRLFAEYHRWQIRNASQTCQGIEPFRLVFPDRDALGNPSSWLRENAVGRGLVELVAIDLSGFHQRTCSTEFRISGMGAVFALKAYEAENGGLPQALEELVPKFLPLVPVDPFDGQPLRYDPSRRTISSVGKDGDGKRLSIEIP